MQCISLLDLMHLNTSAFDADDAIGQQQLLLSCLLSCIKLDVANPGAWKSLQLALWLQACLAHSRLL